VSFQNCAKSSPYGGSQKQLPMCRPITMPCAHSLHQQCFLSLLQKRASVDIKAMLLSVYFFWYFHANRMLVCEAIDFIRWLYETDDALFVITLGIIL